MIKFLIGVVIAAFIVIIGFLVIDPNLNQASNPNLNPITNSENLNAITIEGEVEKPGTYVLEDGVTMSDLILAAGGLTTNADERCYFPTTVLEEGMTYYIAPLYDESDICNTLEITKVNINSDNADQLMTINGFTSTISNAIVTHREENGQFETIEALEDVYGIGPATYKKVRDYVILHE